MQLARIYIETAPRRGTAIVTVSPNLMVPCLEVNLYATLNGKEGLVLAWQLGPKDQKLAARLIKAWQSEAFFHQLEVRPYAVSVNRPGEGYVAAVDDHDFAPLGRKLNADLRRLGY